MSDISAEFRFVAVDDGLVENLDLSKFEFLKEPFFFQYTHLAGLFLNNNIPVSLIAMSRPKNAPDTYYIMFVETADGFKDQKKSKQLFHEMFNYASKHMPNAHFIIDEYTPDGRKYLERKVGDIAENYPNIKFTEDFGFF